MTLALAASTSTNTAINTTMAVAAGDTLIIVAFSAGTGSTVAVSKASGSVTLEGLAANATWSANATTDRDFHNSDSFGGSLFISVWSVKVTASSSGNVTIAGTNAGGNPHRWAVYKLVPNTGNSVPLRALRVLATGELSTTTGTTGANVTDALTMSATTTLDAGGIYLAFAGSGASGTSWDPDNDGTYQITDDYTTGSISATAASKFYSQGDSLYPAGTIHVKYIANPTATRSAIAVVYAAQATPHLLSGKSAAAASAKGSLKTASPIFLSGKANAAAKMKSAGMLIRSFLTAKAPAIGDMGAASLSAHITIAPSAISSTTTIGTPAVLPDPVTVDATAIDPTVTYGDATITSEITIEIDPIASTTILELPNFPSSPPVDQTVNPNEIPTTTTVTTPTVTVPSMVGVGPWKSRRIEQQLAALRRRKIAARAKATIGPLEATATATVAVQARAAAFIPVEIAAVGAREQRAEARAVVGVDPIEIEDELLLLI